MYSKPLSRGDREHTHTPPSPPHTHIYNIYFFSFNDFYIPHLSPLLSPVVGAPKWSNNFFVLKDVKLRGNVKYCWVSMLLEDIADNSYTHNFKNNKKNQNY